MQELKSGIFKLKQRNFAFELSENICLDLDRKRILYVITGDNGTGKTTFLELVIIPWLQKLKITFTCKGQDIMVQGIVERSLNAILGITLTSRKNLLKQIFFNTDADEKSEIAPQIWQPAGLLLDETDKYLSFDELTDMLKAEEIRFVFMITHLLKKADMVDIFKNFDEIYNININEHAELRKVELERW